MAQSLHINRLDISYDYEFDLIAIVSSAKEYTLAWHINRCLEIDLKKHTDIEFNFTKGRKMLISNYLFETEHSTITLYLNKAVESEKNNKPYLLPELKEYDYFFKFEGDSDLFVLDDLIKRLKTIDAIQYLKLIEVDNLPSKDNFIS